VRDNRSSTALRSVSGVGCHFVLRFPGLPPSLAPWTGAPCSRFRVHGLNKMGDPDFLPSGTHQRPRVRLSVRKAARGSPTPPNSTGNPGEAPPFSFPVSRYRPVVKALEKGRLQPMYAKVREHGAPVQGATLVAKREICPPPTHDALPPHAHGSTPYIPPSKVAAARTSAAVTLAICAWVRAGSLASIASFTPGITTAA
jgi:hypothetical protein